MRNLLAMGEKAGALLKVRREKIAVGETSAGGLISAALLAVPGASTYFAGGAVTYSARAVKARFLTFASAPFCCPSRMPSSALNSRASRGAIA